MAVDSKEFPELAKMQAIQGESQSIAGFIEWLGEHKMLIATSEDGLRGTRFHPVMESTEALLARYFEIDLNKVEQERRAVLAKFTASRAASEQSG